MRKIYCDRYGDFNVKWWKQYALLSQQDVLNSICVSYAFNRNLSVVDRLGAFIASKNNFSVQFKYGTL